jgi:hypothetical protein
MLQWSARRSIQKAPYVLATRSALLILTVMPRTASEGELRLRV